MSQDHHELLIHNNINIEPINSETWAYFYSQSEVGKTFQWNIISTYSYNNDFKQPNFIYQNMFLCGYIFLS